MVVTRPMWSWPRWALWDRIARHALAIGRYSLGSYLFHLLLIAIPVLVAGKRPLDTPALAWGYYAFVVIGCYAYAHVRMCGQHGHLRVRPGQLRGEGRSRPAGGGALQQLGALKLDAPSEGPDADRWARQVQGEGVAAPTG